MGRWDGSSNSVRGGPRRLNVSLWQIWERKEGLGDVSAHGPTLPESKAHRRGPCFPPRQTPKVPAAIQDREEKYKRKKRRTARPALIARSGAPPHLTEAVAKAPDAITSTENPHLTGYDRKEQEIKTRSNISVAHVMGLQIGSGTDNVVRWSRAPASPTLSLASPAPPSLLCITCRDRL